jgi:hypothetical protein
MAQVAPQHRERQLRPSRGVSGRRDGPGFRRLRESDYQLPGGCVARFCLRHKDGEAACVLIAREPLVNRTSRPPLRQKFMYEHGSVPLARIAEP